LQKKLTFEVAQTNDAFSGLGADEYRSSTAYWMNAHDRMALVREHIFNIKQALPAFACARMQHPEHLKIMNRFKSAQEIF
jgi:hypothetical protein